MKMLLTLVELHYQKLCDCNSTTGRAHHGKIILELLTEHPELEKFWVYQPNEFLWSMRFRKIEENEIKEKKLPVYIPNGVDFDREIPEESGVYFLGEIGVNPIDESHYYLVKIGESINLRNRMKAYDTHAPTQFRFDFLVVHDHIKVEKAYHKKLSQVSHHKFKKEDGEWFMVDRETFYAMKEKKFDFFQKPLDKFLGL